MKKLLYLALLLGIAELDFARTAEGRLRERIYLQTDKQMYLSGEQVWLKVLTTTPEGRPLEFSKVAYVELQDENGSPVQIKLDVNGGVGVGCMVLPATLPTGYYRLVGYTRYMRNEGADVFFEKHIGVVNPTSGENARVTNQPAVQAKSPEIDVPQNTFALATDKTVYARRSPVKITLEGLPDDLYTLSVSVVGRDYTSAFPQEGITRWQNDLQKIPQHAVSDNYLPEYEGHIITGKLTDEETGRPVDDDRIAPFVAFSGDNIRVFGGQADADGNLLFITGQIAGGKELISSYRNSVGRNLKVDIDSPFAGMQSGRLLPAFNTAAVDKDRLLLQSVALQVLYSCMNDSLNRFEGSAPYFRFSPDRTYLLDEYTRFGTMAEVITEIVVSARFDQINGRRALSVWKKNAGWSLGNTLVLLDGIPVFDHDIIYRYNPSLVTKIDVYFDRYVFGGQGFNGIVAFSTAKNNYPDLDPGRSIRFFPYEGTQQRRLFYAPAYKTAAQRESRLPDYRQTLYWDPDVQTEGRTSLSLPFYTSDIEGEYRILAEGLTRDGKAVHAVSTIKVE